MKPHVIVALTTLFGIHNAAVIPDPPYSYVEVVVPKNGDICADFHMFNSTDGSTLSTSDMKVCYPERFDTTKYTLRNFGRTLYMSTMTDYYGVRRTHFLKLLSSVTTPTSNAGYSKCVLPTDYRWNGAVSITVQTYFLSIIDVPVTTNTRVYTGSDNFAAFRPLDSRGLTAGYAIKGKYIPGYTMYTASASGVTDRVTLLKTIDNTVIEGMYVYLSTSDAGPAVDFSVQFTVVVKPCPLNEEEAYKEGLVLPKLQGAYTDWRNYGQVASVGIFARELEWPQRRTKRVALGAIALGASLLGPVTEMAGGCNTFLIGDIAKAMGSCQPSMESVAKKTQESLLILRDSVKNVENQVDKFGQTLNLASEKAQKNDQVFATAIGDLSNDVTKVEQKVFVTELKMASVEKVGTMRMESISNLVKTTLQQLQSDIASEREILIDERARSYLTTLQIIQESSIVTGGLDRVMSEYSGTTGAVVKAGTETPFFYRFHHVMESPIQTTMGLLEFSGCLRRSGSTCPEDYQESQSTRTTKVMGIQTVCCEDVSGIFIDLVINSWSRCLVVDGSYNCTDVVSDPPKVHFYTRGILSPSSEPTIVFSDGFRRLRESGVKKATITDAGLEVEEVVEPSDTCDFFDPATRMGIEKVGVDCYCYDNCNGTKPVNKTAEILSQLESPTFVAEFKRYNFDKFDAVVDSIDDFTTSDRPYWQYIAYASLGVNGLQFIIILVIVLRILRRMHK